MTQKEPANIKLTKQCSACKKETDEYSTTPFNRSNKITFCTKCFDNLLNVTIIMDGLKYKGEIE